MIYKTDKIVLPTPFQKSQTSKTRTKNNPVKLTQKYK